MQATLAQVEQASVWYHDAQDVAHNVASNLGVSMEVGASIVAAFSPRERWSSNVHKALSFSMGMQVKGLTNNIKMANDALELGFDALKGQKTNAFARAIAGDTDAVVIDVWMIRAAGMDASKGVNKSDYNMLADTVRNIASEHGLTPRTAQALIWIVKRGSAE
jgi:putative NIF3 family GTP cyclohydrolase 1 type 2